MAIFSDLSKRKNNELARINLKKKSGGFSESPATQPAQPKVLSEARDSVLRETATLSQPKKSMTSEDKHPTELHGTKANRVHRKHREKHLLIFGAIGFFVVSALNLFWIKQHGLELRNKLVLGAKSGFEKLVSAGASFEKTEFSAALGYFEEAKKEFDILRKELWFLNQNSARGAASGNAAFAATSLVEAGKLLGEAGMIFTESAARLETIPKLFLGNAAGLSDSTGKLLSGATKLVHDAGESLQEAQRESLTELLKKEIPHLRLAAQKVAAASDTLSKVSSSIIPKEFHEQFMNSRVKLQEFSSKLRQILDFMPAVLDLLGDERPHRLLILSQNRYETRPSGGFIGSYILATMNDGYLTEFEPHDVYASDYLLKDVIQPPEEFRPLLSRWFMRDCNYHPNFAVSGERCAWFLQKEGGPSVDSVIAIDQTVAEDLLRLTGPIYFEPFRQFITADNFAFIFSYVTEAKLAGRDDPKKLLRDFIARFRTELFAKANFSGITAVMTKAVREKHILAYSRETEVDGFFDFATRGAGRIPEIAQTVPAIKETQTISDYLQVVNYSIGGNKSDEYIRENISHKTFFLPDGTIENELTVQKTHKWTPEAEKRQNQLLASFGFPPLDSKLRWILGQGNNFTAMRIYVPAGSALISREGGHGTFEVIPKEDPEFPRISAAPAPDMPVKNPDTQYFSTKMDVKAGETVTLKIRYRLPWKFKADPTAEYHFQFEKQPGLAEVEFEKRIFPAPGMTLLRTIPAQAFPSHDSQPKTTEEQTEDRLTLKKTLRKNFELATLWR